MDLYRAFDTLQVESDGLLSFKHTECFGSDSGTVLHFEVEKYLVAINKCFEIDI